MYTERLILIYLLGGYLLSPFVMNWANNLHLHPWYFPYLIWAALIATAIWATQSKDIDDF